MDERQSTGTQEPPPSAALSGWIRELLAGVDAGHLRKLGELRESLESEIFALDAGPLAQALQALHSAARDIHLAGLRKSWLHRVLGRHRAAYRRFAAAVDRMDAAAAVASGRASSLAATFKAHNQSVRRIFVSFDIEAAELVSDVDRGVTWLQAMCDDINRQRESASRDRGLATLAETAQSYTMTFKRLQAIESMVRELSVRGHAILDRRAALLEQVRSDMDHFDRQWNARVGEVAAQVRAGQAHLPGIGQALEAHDEAMKRLDAALDASGALQREELFMAEQLDSLRLALPGAPAADR